MSANNRFLFVVCGRVDHARFTRRYNVDERKTRKHGDNHIIHVSHPPSQTDYLDYCNAARQRRNSDGEKQRKTSGRTDERTHRQAGTDNCLD